MTGGGGGVTNKTFTAWHYGTQTYHTEVQKACIKMEEWLSFIKEAASIISRSLKEAIRLREVMFLFLFGNIYCLINK